MKNFFKIIFILILTIFAVTGCADDSGGNGGGNGEVYTPEFTRLISIGGLSYGETADGKKYAWGNVGELTGAGNTDDIRIPKEVDFTIIDNITDYIYSTYYIITDTGLYAWGYNGNGQVGNGTSGSDVLTPYKVAGIDGNIKDIIADDTVYVLTDTGLYAWGDNWFGQVGNGTTEDVLTPYKVAGIDGNIKDIIADDTVYVLTDTGLYAWGGNSYGQVGNGNTDSVLTLHKVEGIDGNIKDIIADDTVYVLTDTGLYAWGYNGSGQVGNGNTDITVTTPNKVEGIDGNIKEVITSGWTVYVLTDTGLYAWGNNILGQVGNGKTDNVLTPHKVEGIDGNIKEVITNGVDITVYVLTDTGLYAWGNNSYGQVGNGASGNNVLTPHKAVNGDIKEFIISGNISFATYYVITDDGLYAWGNNSSGQVGNGTTDNVLTPYKVEGIDGNIKEVIVNNATVYVLTDTGLYAWGYNWDGQVGNGTTKDVLTPHKAVEGNIKDIIADNTVYVLTDTGLYAWGDNSYGQVGNGTTDNVLTPYKVQIEKQN